MFAPYLTKLIRAGRVRPGMIWGDSSLKSVSHSVDGFGDAIREFAPEHSSEIFPKLAFTIYVAARLKKEVGAYSWSSLLLATFPDDGTAHSKFCALYEEFLAPREVVAQKSRFRILRYPDIRGYFVVAMPPLDWGDFCLFSTLRKAKIDFLKKLKEEPNQTPEPTAPSGRGSS